MTLNVNVVVYLDYKLSSLKLKMMSAYDITGILFTDPLRTAYRLTPNPEYCVPKGGGHPHTKALLQLILNLHKNSVFYVFTNVCHYKRYTFYTVEKGNPVVWSNSF